MNKYLFEDWLRNRLDDLPPEELERIVAFYLDAIDERMEEGMTEEEAIHDLGEPEGLLAGIRASLPQETVYTPVRQIRQKTMCRRKWIVAGILMVVLVFALPIFLLAINFSTMRHETVYEVDTTPVEAAVVEWEGDESTHTFDPVTLNKIHVSANLGRVMVEPCDDNWIHVVGNEDVFDANVRGATLYLENVNDDLLIRMPMAWYLRLDIKSDVGDVEIYEITAATLDVSADLGNIYLHNVTAAERIDLAADVGNIEGSLKYRQEDYCIDVEVDVGQCNLTDLVNDGTPLTITADLGNVYLEFEE